MTSGIVMMFITMSFPKINKVNMTAGSRLRDDVQSFCVKIFSMRYVTFVSAGTEVSCLRQ